MAIEGPASFLSQMPQALLGRPSTGILDFAKGALYGLGTGDTGGYEPGILGSLGRIGMMALAVRQSKDPTAILKVKDYFDQQDQLKRNALAAPDAGNLSATQFQSKYGFVPPSENRIVQPSLNNGGFVPAGASDIMGGRAQVQPMTIATPADLEQQMKYGQLRTTLNAAQKAGPDTYEGRQILQNGFGPQERTKEASANFELYTGEHPINPKTQYIGYRTGPNGEVFQTIETRDETLLDDSDISQLDQYYASRGLKGKVAAVPDIAGFDENGKPLYKVSPFSMPKEGGGKKGSGNPANDIYYALLPTLGPEEAAKRAGMIHRLMNPLKEGEGDIFDRLEVETGAILNQQDRVKLAAMNELIKADYVDPAKKQTRIALGGVDPEVEISKIITAGIARKREIDSQNKDPRDVAEDGVNDGPAPRKVGKVSSKGTTDPNDFSQYAPYEGQPVGTDSTPGAVEVVINSPGKYDTPLSKGEEKDFVLWKARMAPQDSGEDYDWRGAFKAGVKPGENGHWPDKFKKPNHPTFSEESQYAVGEDAKKAGKWEGENYVKSENEEDKVPRTSPTPGNAEKGPRASRPDVAKSPETKPTPAPRLKLKGKEDISTDTARDLDNKITENGYAPGHLQELAGILSRSDLNVVERAKVLEDIVKRSKKMSKEQKDEALRKIPKLVGVK